MSHISKFKLQVTDKEALVKALQNLGCEIFEGKMKEYYGGWTSVIPSSATSAEVRGKPVEFGFSFKKNGYTCDRFGFAKDNTGNYVLVGDNYGYGLKEEVISNIIENMYVNTRVDLGVVSMLEALGFTEATDESNLNLLTFAGV